MITKKEKKRKEKYPIDLQICIISSSSRLLPWHHMQTMRQQHKSLGENTKFTLLTFAWIIKQGRTEKVADYRVNKLVIQNIIL